MKLEDCKVGMKVKVMSGTIPGTDLQTDAQYPHGVGEIYKISEDSEAPISVNPSNWWLRPDQLEPYTEEGQEYRQLKDITPRAIFQTATGAIGCTLCFMEEFTRFVIILDLEYEETPDFDSLVWELDSNPKWTDWLVKHGFIEKVVEEVTYVCGNRLIDDKGDKAILAEVGYKEICIVPLNEKCNRWVDPIRVFDSDCITVKEFEVMNGATGTWRKDK